MGGVLSINQPVTRHLSHTLSDPYMYHHQTASMGVGICNSIGGEVTSSVPDYLKPVVSGIPPTGLSKQMSLGLEQNMNTASVTSSTEGKDRQLMRMNASTSDEVRNWTNSGNRHDQGYRSTDHHSMQVQSHPSDDSAPTPVDHIISSGYTPTVARRAGNPFFTGGGEDDNNSSSSGSWLFRPGKKVGDGGAFQSDKLYEAKVEFQSQPNSKMAKKTVRYVPRPSELRELNFWSPTSM